MYNRFMRAVCLIGTVIYVSAAYSSGLEDMRASMIVFCFCAAITIVAGLDAHARIKAAQDDH